MQRGLTLDTLAVGQVTRHLTRRTVTETDNLLGSVMIMSVEPLQLDAEFARLKSPSGERLVNSLFTLGLMVGISGTDISGPSSATHLVLRDVRFPSPVRIGDTLRVESEMLSRDANEDGSIATVLQLRAYTQRDALVASANRIFQTRPADLPANR